MGAAGIAATELDDAARLASECAAGHGNLQVCSCTACPLKPVFSSSEQLQHRTQHHSCPLPPPPAQAAWKLLGDALLQHAAVTPLSELRLLAGAPAGAQAAEAAGAAVQARAKAVRGARVAYSKALHLDPTQGRTWTTHLQCA